MTKAPCAVEECSREHYAKGFCHLHWRRLRVRGEVGSTGLERLRTETGVCVVEGCTKPSRTRLMCDQHYARSLRAEGSEHEDPERPQRGGWIITETPWRDFALCRGADPAQFVNGNVEAMRKVARTICSQCPVREPCYDYGRLTRSVGVWGGHVLRRVHASNPVVRS